MMAVLVSAVLYAVSDVLLGVVAFSRFFSQPVYGYTLLFFGFYMALIGFVGLGWITLGSHPDGLHLLTRQSPTKYCALLMRLKGTQ
jgi:hypothetical protein